MKKILAICIIYLMITVPVFAEGETQATQEVDIDASGVVLVINKQPKTSAILQTVKIRRCGFIFIGNINGKVEVTTQDSTKKD